MEKSRGNYVLDQTESLFTFSLSQPEFNQKTESPKSLETTSSTSQL